MSNSFDLPEITSFAAGTEGPVGQRVFYLQAVAGSRVVSLRLEKQQVAMLAEYLAHLLATYDLADSPPAHMPDLHQPVIPEWTVGSMMVAVDEAATRVVVICEEIGLDDPDTAAAPEVAQARFALTRGQADAFVSGARGLVARGRPDCPLCGRPMDADGHFCPRLN